MGAPRPYALPSDFPTQVGASRSMNTKGALGVTVNFRVRPKDERRLSDPEEETIIRHLNEEVTWGDFRAVSLVYLGHSDAASIYITLVYRRGLRHRLEILEIGNPNVPLTGSQLEDIKNALGEIWRGGFLT